VLPSHAIEQISPRPHPPWLTGSQSGEAIADGAVADGAIADGAVADGAVADGAIADGAWWNAAPAAPDRVRCVAAHHVPTQATARIENHVALRAVETRGGGVMRDELDSAMQGPLTRKRMRTRRRNGRADS
jgi:hypothetical protein